MRTVLEIKGPCSVTKSSDASPPLQTVQPGAVSSESDPPPPPFLQSKRVKGFRDKMLKSISFCWKLQFWQKTDNRELNRLLVTNVLD